MKPGVFEGPAHFRGGLFGLFSDSLPDGWGSLLLDRKLQEKGLSYDAISPLDRLSLIGSGSFGALEYEPSDSASTEDVAVHLDSLAYEADAILAGRPSGLLDELLRLNGFSGGTRPKITALVSDDRKTIIPGSREVPPGFSLWLIKLSNSADRKDAGLHEYVFSLIAQKCGIHMPETHLFPSRTSCGHFGVKRFDRNGSQKIHIHSACGLLHADFRTSCLDYGGLLKLTQILTRNYQEVAQMVRLMVFNVKAGNKDDHSRNFSFMLDEGNTWKLAPAYDLTRSCGINGEQTALVNGKGASITDEDLIAEALKAGISKAKTMEMIEEVSSCLADYDKILASARNLASEWSGMS
ncbi:MAG: type II toxin-antitoxin system HipA family toxin [Desulfovibrionaceae bacterium]|nr:type II toxin-antitoxin system HipA family toxin [Desulfovibrionaceae bacterium]